jgi:argininosuccinate lyase
MPQQKNPDLVELARGKTGRLYGNLVSVMTMLKGLPTSYNRDLQEDKEALFDSVDTVSGALELFTAMLPEIRINTDRMEKAANDPALLATDVADYLVTKGVAFRDAYDAVGKLVARAAEMGVPLNNVPLVEMKKLSLMFDDEIGGLFDVRASLAKRTAAGAPSPKNISERINFWDKQLSGGSS